MLETWRSALGHRDAEIAQLGYFDMWSRGVAKALLTALLSDTNNTFKSVDAHRAHVDGFLRGKPGLLSRVRRMVKSLARITWSLTVPSCIELKVPKWLHLHMPRSCCSSVHASLFHLLPVVPSSVPSVRGCKHCVA